MTQPYDILVIGGGQAGLAAGYQLRQAGLSFAILEAAAEVGGSWPSYYDSLRLFSPANRSGLPGMPFPGDPQGYPTRDQVVAYLREYARRFALPVIAGARVLRVERGAEGFRALTADGRAFAARGIIAASGAFHRPYMPELPGQASFAGQLLHAASYRRPEPFAGQRVVVVGAGNSAIQIAAELTGVTRVTLATREPIRFRRQKLLGRDVHHWAWRLGLDRLPVGGLAAQASAGVIDTGAYQAAIAAGRPARRAMFTRFNSNGVVWADGSAEPVDAVIFATGYRPSLDYLAGLGALDDAGQPLQRRGVSTSVAGLAYVGLANQSTYASATLRGVGPDAAYVIGRLRRQLGDAEPRSRAFGRWRCCAGRQGLA